MSGPDLLMRLQRGWQTADAEVTIRPVSPVVFRPGPQGLSWRPGDFVD
jgi:hypothetical protein